MVTAFLLGCMVGPWLNGSGRGRSAPQTDPDATSTTLLPPPSKGSFVQLQDLPFRPTSHTDERGRPILKRQLLDPFVVPRHVGFSVATLGSDQSVSGHAHASLHEFFYVLSSGPSGGTIQVEGVNHTVREGSFVHVAPGERHAVFADPSNVLPLVFLVTGVVLDDHNNGRRWNNNGLSPPLPPSGPPKIRKQS